MSISLERFELSDVDRLTEIMQANIEAAGRTKDYKKFIEWNLEHPEDLYWKIVLRTESPDISFESGSDSSLKSSEFFIGYIGFAQASTKLTTRDFAGPKDLFLEIYLDPEYTGKGYGEEAFKASLKRLPRDTRRIYASTYISNVKAQRFFISKLGMKVLCRNKKYNVVILSSRDGVVLTTP